MALSAQDISRAILEAWTANPNAGLASLQTCPDRDKMLAAQTDAIAKAVCGAICEAFAWQTETATLASTALFRLAKEPCSGSLCLFLNGLLLAPATWRLDGKTVTFTPPCTGTLVARYQSIEVFWRVLLVEIGDRKIDVIKAVRDLLGLGLKDAKDLVDAVQAGTPQVVLDGADRAAAIAACERFAALGAKAEMSPLG